MPIPSLRRSRPAQSRTRTEHVLNTPEPRTDEPMTTSITLPIASRSRSNGIERPTRELLTFEMVTESASFRRTLSDVRRFVQHGTTPILLEGESGTGKTMLARYMHAISPCASKPFHWTVLAGLDDTLASSDLFGHVAGAFTDAKQSRQGHFVASRGSTLFLDEIGKASRFLQAKLLHAIEYNEITPVGSDHAVHVDVRIIAATNVPLASLVKSDQFLPDLSARFGYFRIYIPPLRERRPDLPGLITQCVNRYAEQFCYVSPPDIHPELQDALCNAEWPTNLRGLDMAIKYIFINAEGALLLTLEHCGDMLDDIVGDVVRRGYRYTEEQTRKSKNTAALVHDLGSVSATARTLGVARSTVQRRLRKNAEEVSGEGVNSD